MPSTAAGPAVFVRLKFAVAFAPLTDAITVYVPAFVLAVNAGEVALPLESVVAAAVVLPPLNVPLAPEGGAEKFTVTPTWGVPLFVTVATRGKANWFCTWALCEEPLFTVIVAPSPPPKDEDPEQPTSTNVRNANTELNPVRITNGATFFRFILGLFQTRHCSTKSRCSPS
jgi:hypothetical protein